MWGVRDLTAAFQNTRRIAPTRQLAHGVAELASREQQQQQQPGESSHGRGGTFFSELLT